MLKVEVMPSLQNCRICLQTKNLVLLSLSNEIRDIFHKITNLQLIKSEGLSNLICNICYKKLIETRNYRDDLISNELILIKQLQLDDPYINEEDTVPIKTEGYEIVDVIEEEHLEEYLIDTVEVGKVENSINIFNAYTTSYTTQNIKNPRKRPTTTTSNDEESTPKKNPRSLVQKAPKISKEFKEEIANMPTNAEGKVTCPHCLKTMKKVAYAQHFERSHLGVKNFMCDLCGKDFYKIWDLRAHMSLHMDELPIKCTQCEKRLRTKAHLRRHLLYEHDKNKNFVCEICAAKFKENHKLQNHIRVKHNGLRFKCPYEDCKSEFTAHNNLLTHMRTQHEAKDEPCDICGKMYRAGRRMYAHKRHQHSDLKYECSYCEKRFSTKERKLYHEEIHNGEKSHVCSICNVSYRRQRNLARHIKVSHRKSKFFCKIPGCSSVLSNKDNLRAHVKTVHKSLPPELMEAMLEDVKEMKPEYYEEVDEKLM